MTPPQPGRAARATLAALGTLTLEELRLVQVTVAEEVQRRLAAPANPTTTADCQAIRAAKRRYRRPGELVFDRRPLVCHGMRGACVACWVYVPHAGQEGKY